MQYFLAQETVMSPFVYRKYIEQEYLSTKYKMHWFITAVIHGSMKPKTRT